VYQVSQFSIEKIKKFIDVNEIVWLSDAEVVIEGHVVKKLRVLATA
jgi:hypothetical protein